MGLSPDTVLAQATEGDLVDVTLVSNEDDGIASYAAGTLVFRAATGGTVLGGPRLKPARMETISGQPLKYLFSDRRLNIDPPPPEDTFAGDPRQPFSANAVEPLSVSMTLTSSPTLPVKLSFFGGTSKLDMDKRGKLLVGVGPSLGPSEGGMYVLSFTRLHKPPH